ncbi:hypothetical protein [Viridibacillus arvi]|uniref:hypothetical protein n=1 Tax=Viridibacillus arvi TaxID=263475 RepID=UPI0034CEBCA7
MIMDSVLAVLKRENELYKLQQAISGEKGAIIAGYHTKERYENRGYTNKDIESCLMTGEVVEVQVGFNVRYKIECRNLTVKGLDQSGNDFICIFSQLSRKKNIYTVITIMPPCDKKRFGKLIA